MINGGQQHAGVIYHSCPMVDDQQGYVTVETALSLLSLMAIFSLILAGMSYGVAKIQSCNSLRAVSRTISLGKPLPEQIPGQKLRITEKDNYAEVTISQSNLLSRLKLAPPARCATLVIPEMKKEAGEF